MHKLPVALMFALTLAACGKKLDGAQTTTDHYKETVGAAAAIGDLKVSAASEGDAVTVTFAPPDAAWKDPRPQRVAAGAPQAFLARAGCKLTAKRTDGGSAAIDPKQTCAAGEETLTVEGGTVYVIDRVLYVDLYGELGGKGGPSGKFALVYPFGIVDEPLKLP
jgi:hypothetical protein